MLKKTIGLIIKILLIVLAVLFICIALLRILLTSLDGPTIVIHNDTNETYEVVVAMYTYDNPSWLIKLGPGSFSPSQSIKTKAGASGFSCLYLFKGSSSIPVYAYAPPSVPNETISHTFSLNENIYLLSSFSEPCSQGSFLPTFIESWPL